MHTLQNLKKLKRTITTSNIPRYVDTFEEEEEVDITALQVEIEGVEKELTKVRQKMAGYLKELGIVE